jgi:transcriptional regulator with XRE-family HTH domain
MAEKMRGRALPHLRAWRVERALQQGELADKAAVSRSTIMRAEAGGIVSFSNIRQLAAALEISIEQLVHADAARKDAPLAE